MEFIVLVVLAMVMEFIDSFLGMMYGTVLSPLLILFGYDAKQVVPSILISQAIGGFVASYKHHQLQNANFQPGTIDHQVSTTVIWFGVFASLIGVFISVSIPSKFLNTYIAVLVIAIAVMILLNQTILMTSTKIYFLGFISAFNKALSGGGFGPLVAGGQLIFKDRSEKGAIGSTDFAEAPICLLSFCLWLLIKGLPPLNLMIPVCIGAMVGGFFGPMALSKIKSRDLLKKCLGALVLIEGLWVLYKAWLQ
ncbi:MAG TPA: sulfite exporter TauE/SafE family protein [Smithella sp.]|nr:sulfite exporter TauE/SafE family protein [Smithella sp.]HRS97603.1 sulfite exporter TauE/SafE family protein [Smithella sp.]